MIALEENLSSGQDDHIIIQDLNQKIENLRIQMSNLIQKHQLEVNGYE